MTNEEIKVLLKNNTYEELQIMYSQLIEIKQLYSDQLPQDFIQKINELEYKLNMLYTLKQIVED